MWVAPTGLQSLPAREARLPTAGRASRLLPLSLDRSALLQGEFGLEALDIAEDRGDRQHAAVAAVANEAILRRDVAVDRQVIPRLGVADIVDRHVVVLAPEERHGREGLAVSQHVERGGLALALGHDPMLDANIGAAVRVGPAGDIAGREDTGRAGFEIRIDDDPAIELEARRFGETGPRAYPDARDDQVRLDHAARFQPDQLALDRARGVLEMEDHPMLPVERAHEAAELRPQHARHRHLVRGHDMNLDFARDERRRDLEPNEARAQYDRAASLRCLLDDRAGICKRAQRVHVRLIGAGDRQAYRLRS